MEAVGLKQREDVENKEVEKKAPKLSENLKEYAYDEIEKAVKEGYIRKADAATIHVEMGRLTAAQIENGEAILDKHLKTKREKRKEYIKGLDDGVLDGLISLDEHEQYLAKYDKMPGKDRKKESEEKWPKRLEMKKMEKKKFEALLKESPHFFHEGKLTPEGEALLAEHDDKLKNDREKLVLKKRLIRKTTKLDGFADLCKDRYEIANEYYKRGDYENAAKLMKKNVKTCDRYPESARLKEFNDFAKGDHHNAAYEQIKNEKMNNKREEVQECFQGNDHESALNCASEAVKMMEKIISTTYNGKQGVYQEGSSSEKPRSDKWKTPYMTNTLNKVKQEEAEAKNIHKTLKKEETDEDQRILDGEMDLINKEQSSDKRDQVLIKAALDSANDLHTETQEEEVNQKVTSPTYRPGVDDTHQVQASRFNERDKEEDQELQNTFVDENAQQEERKEEVLQEDQNKDISVSEAQNLSQEELKNEEVAINEEKEGQLDDRKADDLLRSETKLKLTKDGRDLDSEQRIQEELANKLAQSRVQKIDELKRSGKVSSETADLHKEQAQNMDSDQLGRDFMEQDKKGKIIEFKQQRSTQSKLSNIFKKNTDKDKLQNRMQENADQKREQLKKAH